MSTILLFPHSTAYAEEMRYSRVLTENVTLYMDSSLTIPWFNLPVGYYVKVLSINHTTVKVEYKSDVSSKPSVKGYLDIEHLSLCSETPQTLYPSLVLTVNQTCLLYKDVDFTLSETIAQNSTVDFYGIIEKSGGNKYIYGFITATSGDKYVGYIPFSAVYDFTIPSLPIDTQTESVPSSAPVTSEIQVNNNLGNSLQIVIIIAVSLVAVSIVYILFRPTKPKNCDTVISYSDFDDE